MATDNALSVGWIGTGVMGLPMCGHLLAAGFPVKVFSRTKERALPLVEQGAQWCATPAEAANGVDLVVTMVGYPHDVRQVVLGEGGVLTRRKRDHDHRHDHERAPAGKGNFRCRGGQRGRIA